MYEALVASIRYHIQKANFMGLKEAEFTLLLGEAADAIEKLSKKYLASEVDNTNLTGWLAEEHAKHLWIPVTERLPEEDEPVFVARKFLGIKGQVPPSTYTEIAYRIDDNWYADSDEYKIARSKHTDPLFWMPLPEPPREET